VRGRNKKKETASQQKIDEKDEKKIERGKAGGALKKKKRLCMPRDQGFGAQKRSVGRGGKKQSRRPQERDGGYQKGGVGGDCSRTKRLVEYMEKEAKTKTLGEKPAPTTEKRPPKGAQEKETCKPARGEKRTAKAQSLLRGEGEVRKPMEGKTKGFVHQKEMGHEHEPNKVQY